MKFFPEMDTFLQIGSISLRWYSLLMLLSIFIAYLWTKRKINRETGYDNNLVDDLFFGGILSGISGARLWYVVFSPDRMKYFTDPLNIIKTWEGGLAIHGAIVGAAIFIFLMCRKRKISFLRIIDILIPITLVSQALGRWGNFFNQEAYGVIVEEGYFQYFPKFIKEGMYIYGQYRQPMFLLEGFFNIIGFILIYTVIKKFFIKKRGDYAYWYLMVSGIIRFFIEIYRTDNLIVFGLKSAQVVSVLYIIIAFVGLLGLFNKLIKTEKPLMLFDLDGTLVDSRGPITESFNELFVKYKIKKVLNEEESDSVFGPPLMANLKRFFPNQDSEEVLKNYAIINNRLLKESLKPIDGAKKVLNYLKENDYLIAVVSNKPHDSVVHSLEVSDLKRYIDKIIGIDDVEFPKPDKQPIINACNALSKGIDSLIMVGDSPDDIACAKAAGAFSIALGSSPARKESLLKENPNRYIEELDKIIEIIKEKHEWTANMM